MNHQIKRFLFKYYPLLCVTLFIGAIALLIIGILEWQPFAVISGGIGAFAFGVQRQNLEETRLFKELFEQFNSRYDNLNEALNRIYLRPPDVPLDDSEIKTLFKYFNLCGEEYLYAKKGFICGEVWQAWKNGIVFFLRNTRIKRVWDEEMRTDSYYGLH